MRIRFVRPGHDALKAHLQPGAYLEQCAAGLRGLGHDARVLAAPDGLADAAVWCAGPTSMVRQPASRMRGSARRVVAFIPGPVYRIRDLVRGLGGHLLRSAGDHAVHMAGAMTPLRVLVRHVAKAADATVVPTQTLADQLQEAGHPAHRLHVLPPGLDPRVPAAADAHAARALLQDWGIEAPYVVNFGPVRPVRGVDTLVDACVHLPDDVDVLVLARPGDGRPERDRARLEDHLRRLPGGHRVAVRADMLDRRALLGLVERAAVAAFPLRIVQSIVPIAIHESLQLGTPVACTEVPPLPEIVHAPHGAVFRPGRPSELAAAVRSLLDQGASARHAASEWSTRQPTWPEMGRRWQEVLSP